MYAAICTSCMTINIHIIHRKKKKPTDLFLQSLIVCLCIGFSTKKKWFTVKQVAVLSTVKLNLKQTNVRGSFEIKKKDFRKSKFMHVPSHLRFIEKKKKKEKK